MRFKHLLNERGDAAISSLLFYLAAIGVMGLMASILTMSATHTSARDSFIEMKAAAASVTDVVVININIADDRKTELATLASLTNTQWKSKTETRIRDRLSAWVYGATLSGNVLTLKVHIDRKGPANFDKNLEVDIVPVSSWGALQDPASGIIFLPNGENRVPLNLWTLGEIRMSNDDALDYGLAENMQDRSL